MWPQHRSRCPASSRDDLTNVFNDYIGVRLLESNQISRAEVFRFESNSLDDEDGKLRAKKNTFWIGRRWRNARETNF